MNEPLVPEKETPQTEEVFSWKSYVIEVVKFLFLAIIIVVPIRLYVAQPYIVSGASMDPTFKNGDYLIIDQFSYHFENPKRGDVIVFRYPERPSLFFIKRVVGLPGETLESKNGAITVYTKENQLGMPIDQSYLFENYNDTFTQKELGKDEYFVMGDNRRESLDSRIWGTLPRNLIVGRALLRLFPPTRISIMPGHPEPTLP